MKKNLFRTGLALLMIAAFASCQKFGPLTADQFTVNPSPLVVKASKVEGTISATFPEKYFPNKGTVVVTPVLKYDGGEAIGEGVMYQGEKVQGNEKVIQYKPGASVTQKFAYDYIPAMANSTLVLRFNAKLKDKEVQVPEVEIAVGCIATSTLADAATIMPAFAKDNFQRVTQEETEASIMFNIQRSNVKSNADVKALTKVAAATTKEDRREIAGLSLTSSASPDGGVELNEKLAAAREKNTMKYLKRQKTQYAIDAKYISQDWEGFQKLVMSSDVADKDLILRVLGAQQDPELRETEIKNLSSAYKELSTEILPQLRRSHMVLTVNVTGKTDEEIIALAKTAPDSLTVEELIFATTIATSVADMEEFTRAAATVYPADWRTTNNLAAVEYRNGNFTAAAAALEASKLAGGATQAEVNFNAGLLALLNKDLAGAEEMFGKSAGVTQLNEAKGTLLIMQGKYAQAISSFGNTTSNNAALAQLLVNSNAKAASILENVSEKTAATYYLMAVAAARTEGEEAKALSSIKQAKSMDAAFGTRAGTDLEFAKCLTKDAFKAAIN